MVDPKRKKQQMIDVKATQNIVRGNFQMGASIS